MPHIIERMAELERRYAGELADDRKRLKDPARCPHPARVLRGMRGKLRFLAVAAYRLRGDVLQFRTGMREAAEMQKELFLRADRGESVSTSYLSALTYQQVLDALAAGDSSLASWLADRIGFYPNKGDAKVHPLDLAFAWALKVSVLSDQPGAEERLAAFGAVCQSRGNAAFEGYARFFGALFSRDCAAANVALESIAAGHKRLSRANGVFDDTEDEVLCVWGVGVANLARSRGLDVQAVPPLIRGDLLLPVATGA